MGTPPAGPVRSGTIGDQPTGAPTVNPIRYWVPGRLVRNIDRGPVMDCPLSPLIDIPDFVYPLYSDRESYQKDKSL